MTKPTDKTIQFPVAATAAKLAAAAGISVEELRRNPADFAARLEKEASENEPKNTYRYNVKEGEILQFDSSPDQYNSYPGDISRATKPFNIVTALIEHLPAYILQDTDHGCKPYCPHNYMERQGLANVEDVLLFAGLIEPIESRTFYDRDITKLLEP